MGYPLQSSWAFLVAQTVKNRPAVQEASVASLGWQDPLEESMVTHSSILAWKIPMDRGSPSVDLSYQRYYSESWWSVVKWI